MNNLAIDVIVSTINSNSDDTSTTTSTHKDKEKGHSNYSSQFSSSFSSSSVGTNVGTNVGTISGTGTTIERTIEMPLTKISPLPNPSSTSNRNNNRRKGSFVIKATIALAVIVSVTILFYYESASSSFQDEEIEMKALYTGKNNKKLDETSVPDYAAVVIEEEEDSVQESSSSSSSSSSPHASMTIEEIRESSAAQALQCPRSVTNFVINATDAKDECDGLRKAFDKTCSGETDSQSSRRKLKEDHHDADISWNLASFKRRLRKYIHSITPTPNPRRRLQEENDSDEKSLLDEVNDESKEKENEKEKETTPVVAVVEHKPLSPSLPTDSGHMTEKMAGDSLGLNTELSDIAKVIEELGNVTHTHITTTTTTNSNDENNNDASKETSTQTKKEKEEEHEKDIASAAVAVSAIINNPEVIEMQTCCRSILQVFHEECDSPDGEEYADRRLMVVVGVIALCGMIKSLIRHFKIRWLPEAAGCILVGVVGGWFLKVLPNIDFAFSHDMFLRLMVPPIVFEAALNINKHSFRRMLIPIVTLALFGTIMNTLLTAAMVFYGTKFSYHCTNIPFIESLTFGALISSIDPIAVLSVLNNMGMSDKDQIYVIIFGESLLNDGVSIVLFQTLLNFMDENLVIDAEAVYLAALQFTVIAIGSLVVGLACGLFATIYFWFMKGIQTPLVEVIMFICWAFIPYYICDGVAWSGIVAIVAVGFVMDVYIIGDQSVEDGSFSPAGSPTKKRTIKNGLFSQNGFLSAKATQHIRFVTEINSTLMETAIFAYLGIFLFNKRYHWSFSIPLVSIVACLASRALTVWVCSSVSNIASRMSSINPRRPKNSPRDSSDRQKHVTVDGRMQTVLIFAGLRGAMSFALVETIPMFDESTKQGSRLKPELKQMTSACIVFTVFILGGYTDYLLDRLGMKPTQNKEEDVEMISLVNSNSNSNDESSGLWSVDEGMTELKHRGSASRSTASDDPNVSMW